MLTQLTGHEWWSRTSSCPTSAAVHDVACLGSLASCTRISFLAHAEHKGVEVLDYVSAIDGTVMRRVEDGRYAFVHVHQRLTVVVAAGTTERAYELIGKAERDCFISASTTAEIQNDWEISER